MAAAAKSTVLENSDSVRLISLYRKRAKRYDRSSLLLYFAGFRHRAYRTKAIRSLALNEGDTVVDLGCGTGLNFSLLQEKVGLRGRIIGVDSRPPLTLGDFDLVILNQPGPCSAADE